MLLSSRSAIPISVASRRHWQDGVLMLAGAAVLLLCVRGTARPGQCLTGFLSLLAVCLASPAYRRCMADRAARVWADVGRFRSGAGSTPWTAALVFVSLPAAILYLWNDRGMGTGDTWPVLATAYSLVTDGDWDLSETIDGAPPAERPPDGKGLPRFMLRTSSGVYSSYPAGMVTFAIPVAATARLLGAPLDDARIRGRLEKWTAACLAAASVGLFFLLALHLAPPAPACVATALLGAGSVLFTTCGQGLWQHDGIIFWCLLAMLIEFRRPYGPWSAATLLQGVACAMMLACRPSAALLIGLFWLWVFCRAPARAVLLGVAAAIAYAPWAWFYVSHYGHWLGPAVFQAGASNWTPNLAVSLAGVLVSPSRGLLVYQPWLVFALGAWFGRERPPETDRQVAPRGWVWFCVAAVVLHVGLIAAWRCWWGGHCYGSRLLAEIVPLAGLLCVRPIAMLWRRPAGRAMVLGLLAVSFFLHAAGAFGRADYWNGTSAFDTHPERLWSWSHPPFLSPWQHH